MPDWSREIRERIARLAIAPEREASVVEEIREPAAGPPRRRAGSGRRPPGGVGQNTAVIVALSHDPGSNRLGIHQEGALV